MPPELGYALIGIVVVLIIIVVWLARKPRGGGGAAEGAVIELRLQLNAREEELKGTREELDVEGKRRVAAETQLEENKKSIEEQRKLLGEARTQLTDTFKALSVDALRGNTQEFIQKADDVLKPLKETFARYEAAVREMEKSRAGAYEGLTTYLDGLAKAHKSLELQTTKLEQALRAPMARGRWGEITLQRVVELAGLSEYCDFTMQAQTDDPDNRQRPDMVVHLPGKRTIIVDSKVPLNAYLEAMEKADPDERREKLSGHAAAVRTHMRALGAKAYWNQFETAPEYVVLFLPGESFFSAALEGDRSLIEDGIKNRVILATPTTLIMALLTVAHSWQQQTLAENAQRIAEVGKDLYDRICIFARHFGGIGGSLDKAADAYNKAVGSWERRLVPGVEKLKELGAAAPDQEPPELEQTDTSLRKLPPADDEVVDGNDE